MSTTANELELQRMATYLVRTKYGINELLVLRITERAVEVKWMKTGNVVWLMKSDFFNPAFGKPDIEIIEKL